MIDRDLSPETTLTDVDWLKGRCEPPVADIAPTGFDAYVRICHPAERDGRRYVWADVARETGRTAHPLMQWHVLVGASDTFGKHDSEWPGENPRVGHLERDALAPLCDVLARHTVSSGHCSMGIWEGWGFIDARDAIVFSSSGTDRRPIPAAFSRKRPRLTLWGRSYFVFRQPLTAALEIVERWDQSPNVMWPSDHQWFLGTEIDFDSTLIGGTEALADDLLQAPGVDAWRVEADASFTASADTINTHPR